MVKDSTGANVQFQVNESGVDEYDGSIDRQNSLNYAAADCSCSAYIPVENSEGAFPGAAFSFGDSLYVSPVGTPVVEVATSGVRSDGGPCGALAIPARRSIEVIVNNPATTGIKYGNPSHPVPRPIAVGY